MEQYTHTPNGGAQFGVCVNVNADDAVLFTDCPSQWPPRPPILSSFDEAAHTMGLNWAHPGWKPRSRT